MKSATGLPLPTPTERATWFHAYCRDRVGRPLRTTPAGTPLVSRFVTSRFNPGDHVGPPFETLYLAVDGTTAHFEKRTYLGDPFGDPERFVRDAERTKNTGVLDVAVDLRSVVDLTDVTVQALLDTSAQELTGDWSGYQRRHPHTAVRLPTGMAPTQQLGGELFREPGVEGIIYVSAKVPTMPCLVVFTHKLTRPGSLRWRDPRTGSVESYP